MRVMVLQEYYKSILHRDIIERFDAAHPQAVIDLGYKMLCNSGSLYSVNMVFMHWRRAQAEVYYYRTKKGREVDFIIVTPDGGRSLVQVSVSLSDEHTKKRAITSLFEAMDETGCENAHIVTHDESGELKEGGKTINIVPAWKYLFRQI